MALHLRVKLIIPNAEGIPHGQPVGRCQGLGHDTHFGAARQLLLCKVPALHHPGVLLGEGADIPQLIHTDQGKGVVVDLGDVQMFPPSGPLCRGQEFFRCSLQQNQLRVLQCNALNIPQFLFCQVEIQVSGNGIGRGLLRLVSLDLLIGQQGQL